MKWWKITLVIFGAVIVTALGIDAADTLQGNSGTMLSQLISKDGGTCPLGMVSIDTMSTLTCVDKYEASASSKCPVIDPQQMIHTQHNVDSNECFIESKAEALPWRYITRDQAMHMCARVGKRLPTSEEWYLLSLGMSNVEAKCNIKSKNIAQTGSYTECASPSGVYDLVGNAWEWMSDDVIEGIYNNRALPDSGYVTQVDAHGVAVVVSDEPQDMFGKDYFWSKNEGAYGMLRGGYYDSGTDGGIYTVNADRAPTSASIGIGFRCVK